MKLHEHIIHHARRHKERVVAHVNKHHKKYLIGAGILSGMVIYKVIGVMIIFLGMSKMGGVTIGADYYDAEFYAQQELNKISISNSTGSDTLNQPIHTEETGNNITGSDITTGEANDTTLSER